MKSIHSYCKYVSDIVDKNDVDKIYHDFHYGVRIENDDELFGRLLMEINQAGLSWRTILLKEKGFRKAYHNFNIKKVAKYGEKDFVRLMNDASIIRNKLKVGAAIYNAQQILKIQKEYGSFRKWLDETGERLQMEGESNTNLKNEWVKLFKKHFKFVGSEIVGEFLKSISMLEGAHDRRCKVVSSK